jgi:hypothetical protein
LLRGVNFSIFSPWHWNGEKVEIVTTQAAGIFGLFFALYNSLLAVVHYISLASLTSPEDIFGFRGRLVRKTKRAVSPRSFISLVVAWLLISGTLSELIRNLPQKLMPLFPVARLVVAQRANMG